MNIFCKVYTNKAANIVTFLIGLPNQHIGPFHLSPISKIPLVNVCININIT